MSPHSTDLINLILQLATDNQTQVLCVISLFCHTVALILQFSGLVNKVKPEERKQLLKMTSMNEDRHHVGFFACSLMNVIKSVNHDSYKLRKSTRLVVKRSIFHFGVLSLAIFTWTLYIQFGMVVRLAVIIILESTQNLHSSDNGKSSSSESILNLLWAADNR